MLPKTVPGRRGAVQATQEPSEAAQNAATLPWEDLGTDASPGVHAFPGSSLATFPPRGANSG